MKKILIVKTSAIGDVIHTFGALARLKSIDPTCQVDWIVETAAAPVVRAHPDIHRVIEVKTKEWRKKPLASWDAFRMAIGELRQEQYDVVYDFQGNTKSALFTLLAKAKEKVGFSRKCVPEWPNLLVTGRRFSVQGGNIRARYLSLVDLHLGSTAPFNIPKVTFHLTPEERAAVNAVEKQSMSNFMICFGSNWPNKQLTVQGWQTFIGSVGGKLEASFLVIYGSPKEKEIAQEIARAHPLMAIAVGDLSLVSLHALMGRMDAVIAVDSAALALAETSGAPTFSLFGASSMAVYKPLDDQKHGAIQGTCPYGVTFDKRCPRLRTCPTGACIRQLPQDQLIAAFLTWWHTL